MFIVVHIGVRNRARPTKLIFQFFFVKIIYLRTQEIYCRRALLTFCPINCNLVIVTDTGLIHKSAIKGDNNNYHVLGCPNVKTVFFFRQNHLPWSY